jgi:hypothetical protein
MACGFFCSIRVADWEEMPEMGGGRALAKAAAA